VSPRRPGLQMLARDRHPMGDHALARTGAIATGIAIVPLAGCVGALLLRSA